MPDTPTDPRALPVLPEPWTAASTIKCTACGRAYKPRIAPQTAEPASFWWGAPPHLCECGNSSFKGTLGEGPSPAIYTADQMRAYATAALSAHQAEVDALKAERHVSVPTMTLTIPCQDYAAFERVLSALGDQLRGWRITSECMDGGAKVFTLTAEREDDTRRFNAYDVPAIDAAIADGSTGQGDGEHA